MVKHDQGDLFKMSDINGALKEVLKSKRTNVTKPIAGPIVPQNFVILEVTGGPSTGDLTGLVIKIGNANFSSPTTAGFTNDQEAAAAAVAWQAGINATFGAGIIAVTNPSAPSNIVDIRTTNGMPLNLTDEHSFDATTGSDIIEGTHLQNAVMHEVATAGTGFPNIWSDGFILDPVSKDSDCATPVTIRAELKNLSGGLVRARWCVFWWFDYLGWELDQEVGFRTISETSGSEIVNDTVTVSAVGASRIAVVFVDDDGSSGSTPNLPTNATFSAWAVTGS